MWLSRSGIQVVNVNLSIPRCSPCENFEQTGQLYVHMRAAILYEKNRPVSKWHGKFKSIYLNFTSDDYHSTYLEQETESQRIAVKPKGSAAIPRQFADYPFDTQMLKLVEELLQDPEYTVLDSKMSTGAVCPMNGEVKSPASQSSDDISENKSGCK